MTKILHIETATKICSVALSEDGELIALRESEIANSHAELLTVFIEDMMNEFVWKYKDLNAVAVSMGPGSYTGLRIGVSSAKGLCYSLDIPLISINTLKSMACGMEGFLHKIEKNILFCPMIDARRMEVYTAIFDNQRKLIRQTKAEIIDKNSFHEYFKEYFIYFAGDGAIKCKSVLNHQKNAIFLDAFQISAKDLIEIAHKKFNKNQFENTAYFEPFYLKDFIAGTPKVKGLN